MFWTVGDVTKTRSVSGLNLANALIYHVCLGVANHACKQTHTNKLGFLCLLSYITCCMAKMAKVLTLGSKQSLFIFTKKENLKLNS